MNIILSLSLKIGLAPIAPQEVIIAMDRPYDGMPRLPEMLRVVRVHGLAAEHLPAGGAQPKVLLFAAFFAFLLARAADLQFLKVGAFGFLYGFMLLFGHN